MVDGVIQYSTDICLAVVVILVLWPGYRQSAEPQRPKKGNWAFTARLWPLGTFWWRLGPKTGAMAEPMRTCLALAAFVAASGMAAAQFLPRFNLVLTQQDLVVELVIVALLFGRASGFWSASRRIARRDSAASTGDITD